MRFQLNRTVTAVAFIVIAVAALAALVAANFEVVAKGQLLPYTKGRIYELRFFDAFNIYVEPEHKPTRDALTAYFLTGISFMSLAFALLLHRFDAVRPRNMFAVLFAGASFLAADEYLGLHESLGHNMQFLRALPGVTRPDDLIVASYLLPAALFGLVFLRELSRSRRGLWFVGAAFGLVLIGVVADMFSLPGEEAFELLGAGALVMAVAELGVTHVMAAGR